VPAAPVPNSQATQSAINQVLLQGEPFDEPLRKTVVDLGPSQNTSPDRHDKLSCYYYPRFLVKELNLNELGAEWIAIAPVDSVGNSACKKDHGKGEFTIDDQTGYFAGVKKNLVFLNAEDDFNGGYPFGVFDSATGKKLFEDSREAGKGVEELKFSRGNGNLILRYQRIYVADCSIPRDKSACSAKIVSKTGLTSQSMPSCSGYGGNIDETDPSVVSFPVEVALTSKPGSKLLPGSVKCWAAD